MIVFALNLYTSIHDTEIIIFTCLLNYAGNWCSKRKRATFLCQNTSASLLIL
jgi:hypothetical protein